VVLRETQTGDAGQQLDKDASTNEILLLI